MKEEIYMVIGKDKKFSRSGRGYTPFTTTHLSSAKRQATRVGGKVVVVTKYEELKENK